jgi:hypothetical protein
MANNGDKFLSRGQEKTVLNAAAAVARTLFPNAERIACPELSVLKQLATRRRALSQSASLIEHIGTCSPCFVDYTRFRVTHKKRIRTACALAAAAVVTAVLVAMPRIRDQVLPTPSKLNELAGNRKPSDFETPVTLDLRGRGATRGIDETHTPSTRRLQLPRRRLSLAIYLPIGSEEGLYEVNLVKVAGESVLRASGTATFEKPVVVLHLFVDLSNVSPGVYQLQMRQLQRSWHVSTVIVE